MTSGPYEDGKNYTPSVLKLSDKPGYPANTRQAMQQPKCVAPAPEFTSVSEEVRAVEAGPEPMFTLHASDVLAPIIVRLWAQLQQHNPEASKDRIEHANQIAAAMEAWAAIRYPGK